MSKKKEAYAYVCKTDWIYHVPDDYHGINIYFSEKAIRELMPCVEECGIVKIKLSYEEVVEKTCDFCDVPCDNPECFTKEKKCD